MANSNDMPFWEKYLLTIPEASKYFHLGDAKIYELVELYGTADFILKNGGRTLIKRRKFEQFLDSQSSI